MVTVTLTVGGLRRSKILTRKGKDEIDSIASRKKVGDYKGKTIMEGKLKNMTSIYLLRGEEDIVEWRR